MKVIETIRSSEVEKLDSNVHSNSRCHHSGKQYHNFYYKIILTFTNLKYLTKLGLEAGPERSPPLPLATLLMMSAVRENIQADCEIVVEGFLESPEKNSVLILEVLVNNMWKYTIY